MGEPALGEVRKDALGSRRCRGPQAQLALGLCPQGEAGNTQEPQDYRPGNEFSERGNWPGNKFSKYLLEEKVKEASRIVELNGRIRQVQMKIFGQ